MVEPLSFGRSAETRAAELSEQINRLHVNYLQADDSPQKIEQRLKLENYIRKYLCIVAHARKFIFQETAEVLHRSFQLKENFSAYRACTAWNAIARYAANLVSQPWRKEFTVIKTFSGFYMHDIEENLIDAKLVLDRMGYRQVSHSTLLLEQPLDLDAVMAVSRDAIVAFVECQIITEIWEGVSSQFECSWLEILNFRESHICTPESAVKNITFHYHQNRFHQQQIMTHPGHMDPYNSAPRFHHHVPDSSCVYGQTASSAMSYYGYPPYQAYTVPAPPPPPQPRYASLASPQQLVGYPLSPVNYHQHSKTPVEIFPTNGYHYSHAPQLVGGAHHNGCSTSHPPLSVVPNYGCVVPTGQLIELESNAPMHTPKQGEVQNYDSKNGEVISNFERSSIIQPEGGTAKVGNTVRGDAKSIRPTTLEDLKPKRNGFHADHVTSPGREDSFVQPDKHAGGKHYIKHSKKVPVAVAPMQDGTGTWESWDYVYRNLESQGYNKDMGERGDILHSPSKGDQRANTGSAGSAHSATNIYSRNSRNIRDAKLTAAVDTVVQPLTDMMQNVRLTDEIPGARAIDVVDSRDSVFDNHVPVRGSPVRDKSVTKVVSAVSKTLNREPRRETDRYLVTNPDVKVNRDKEVDQKEKSNFWECIYCTYHNVLGKDVCEMCGKSRNPGVEDKPLISGGQECPKCTLVNQRGVSSCEACNESLKGSPTYI